MRWATVTEQLTKEEIEKMRKDAEAHADDDKKRREEIELRNEADNAVYRDIRDHTPNQQPRCAKRACFADDIERDDRGDRIADARNKPDQRVEAEADIGSVSLTRPLYHCTPSRSHREGNLATPRHALITRRSQPR